MNNDLISREALKNVISEKLGIYIDGTLNNRLLFDLIDNAPTVWIPVSEKLPDLWEIVLVTDECGNVFEYERRQLDDDGNVCREWSFLGKNIIAWMPLPEPYKKGGAEK